MEPARVLIHNKCHLTGFCTSLKSAMLKSSVLSSLSDVAILWPVANIWVFLSLDETRNKNGLAAFNLIWFLHKSETRTSRIHLWNGFIYFIHSVVNFPPSFCRPPSVAIKASQPGQLGPLCSRFLVSFAKHVLWAVFLGLRNYFPILRAVRARHSETQMDWPAAEIRKWST